MSYHARPVTDEEAKHPLTRCQHCGQRQDKDHELVVVSVKTPYEDDYYYECRGFCDVEDHL